VSQPTVGIAILGTTIVPPSSATRLAVESTFATSTVHTQALQGCIAAGVSPRRGIRPPSMPIVPFSPVLISQ
jgi:hypothetical protein